MPSVAKSNAWFVRVTAPMEFLKSKVTGLIGALEAPIKLLAVYHEGDSKENPHCHFVVLYQKEVQKQSIDVKYKKHFGVSGNQYSSKPWDGRDEACAYMFHESDDISRILANKGFTDEDIERFKEMNRVSQKVQEINKEKASGRVVNKIIAIANESWTKHDILNEMFKRIREGDMYEPGDFMLKRYVEEIYLKLRPDDEWEDYCRNRALRILSNY